MEAMAHSFEVSQAAVEKQTKNGLQNMKSKSRRP